MPKVQIPDSRFDSAIVDVDSSIVDVKSSMSIPRLSMSSCRCLALHINELPLDVRVHTCLHVSVHTRRALA